MRGKLQTAVEAAANVVCRVRRECVGETDKDPGRARSLIRRSAIVGNQCRFKLADSVWREMVKEWRRMSHKDGRRFERERHLPGKRSENP